MTDSLIEVPREALIKFAHNLALESYDHQVSMPDGISTDSFFDSFENAPNHTDSIEVEILDDETILISGTLYVVKVVDYLPASGGGRGEPPINPPEYVMEDVEIEYEILLSFDGLGHASIRAEPL